MSRNYWIRLVLAVMAILLEGCSGVSAWGGWRFWGGSGRGGPLQQIRPARRARAGWAGRPPDGRRPRRTQRRPRRPCRTRRTRGSAAPARHHAEPGPPGHRLRARRTCSPRDPPQRGASLTYRALGHPVQDRSWLCLLKSSGLLLIGIPDASTCRSDVSLSPMRDFTAESRRSLGGDGEIRTPEGFYPQPS